MSLRDLFGRRPRPAPALRASRMNEAMDGLYEACVGVTGGTLIRARRYEVGGVVKPDEIAEEIEKAATALRRHLRWLR